MLQPPEPIDWAAWKKELDPKLVDQFKTTIESESAARGVPSRGILLAGGD